MLSELEFWQNTCSSLVQLPLDHPGPAENRVFEAGHLDVEFSAEKTQQLLTQVPGAYRSRVDDILLTALTLAFAQWRRSYEQSENALLVAVEGHGREDLFNDINLSRTVGWFTSLYPVRLDWE